MVFIVLGFLVMPLSAFAYLDAGTMSMIINAIVGVLVGVLYTVRVFWGSIKSFFQNLFGGRKNDEATQERDR